MGPTCAPPFEPATHTCNPMESEHALGWGWERSKAALDGGLCQQWAEAAECNGEKDKICLKRISICTTFSCTQGLLQANVTCSADPCADPGKECLEELWLQPTDAAHCCCKNKCPKLLKMQRKEREMEGFTAHVPHEQKLYWCSANCGWDFCKACGESVKCCWRSPLCPRESCLYCQPMFSEQQHTHTQKKAQQKNFHSLKTPNHQNKNPKTKPQHLYKIILNKTNEQEK